MVDIYKEISTALSAVNGLSRVDIAPRVETSSNIYPAAYVAIEELSPLNTLGCSDGDAALIFSVEYWLMPFGNNTQGPALNELEPHLKTVENARRILLKHYGNYVYNITLLNEKIDTDKEGCYVVAQRWGCNSNLWSTELLEWPNLPIELELG